MVSLQWGDPHHVTQCGNRRQQTFFRIACKDDALVNRLPFLDRVGEA